MRQDKYESPLFIFNLCTRHWKIRYNFEIPIALNADMAQNRIDASPKMFIKEEMTSVLRYISTNHTFRIQHFYTIASTKLETKLAFKNGNHK